MDSANTDTFTVGQSSMQKRLSKCRRDRFEPTGRVTSMSLGRYLLEEWLPRVELSVEPVTASGYKAHVEHHINPYLGHVRVGKLDRRMIQNLYATLLHEKSPKTNQPLSKSTVIRIHGVLHCALEDLVFSGRLASNPARGARPRRMKSEQREHRIWTQPQLSEFLESARADRLFALWRVLALTGMRRGEAVALQCSDLRLKTSTSRLDGRSLSPTGSSTSPAREWSRARHRPGRRDGAGTPLASSLPEKDVLGRLGFHQ